MNMELFILVLALVGLLLLAGAVWRHRRLKPLDVAVLKALKESERSQSDIHGCLKATWRVGDDDLSAAVAKLRQRGLIALAPAQNQVERMSGRFARYSLTEAGRRFV